MREIVDVLKKNQQINAAYIEGKSEEEAKSPSLVNPYKE